MSSNLRSIGVAMASIDLGKLHYKQGLAYDSEATEILFGGAAGPGKSHFLRIASIAWSVEIPGLQTYLFRRKYTDLYDNHMTGPTGFPVLLAPLTDARIVRINYGDNNILFSNGSTIHLRHAQHAKDIYNYQGAEIHLLLIDELTQWPPEMYRFLRSRVRLGGFKIPEKYKGQFPKVIASSNPGGIGHNWVKNAFVDFAAPYEIKKVPREDGGMRRQFIPAFLSDNPTMAETDPDYADRLHGLHDPALVRAMLSGDWDIVAGGAVDDVWSRDVHVIEPFQIPSSWHVDRSFDWGSARPFSVGWWAESDGTPAKLPGGRQRHFPRGTLIRIAEWYGWNGNPNEGLGLTDDEIGRGIREREESIKAYHGISRIHPGPADSSIFNADPGKDSIASGINAGYWGRKGGQDIFTTADKSPGSRRARLQTLRRRLRAALAERPEEPGLYIFSTCTDGFIRTVPVLPRSERDPEDVDTEAEDHAYDEAGYRLTAAKRIARRVKVRMG